MSRAIAELRRRHDCTALVARTRLNDKAAKSGRNIVVLAAEVIASRPASVVAAEQSQIEDLGRAQP